MIHRMFGMLAVLTVSLLASSLNAGDVQRVVLVGDSTVASRTGWGDRFCKELRPDVQWVNLARGGRSSKSYRSQGWWQKALDEKPTWILIQFGHNDQPGKGPDLETDPQTSFRENLTRYVNEARDAGAQPVLVTSLTRRRFDSEGKIDPENLEPLSMPQGYRLTDYARATRAVAEELNVPVIDLNTLSVQEMNRLGPEAAEKYDPRVKASQPPDKTHLNSYGAAETARLVIEEIRRVIPEFVPLLRKESIYHFAFGAAPAEADEMQIDAQTVYQPERGYGYLTELKSGTVPVFAVDVPEGNYEVTIQFGDPAHPTSTTIRAEARRLVLEKVETAAGEFVTRMFTVNVRQPQINSDSSTTLNSREMGPPLHPNWDQQLSLEFNGSQPGVNALTIQPARDVLTVFIAGDSTVTDQRNEPYAGWGQMLPRFFTSAVAVSNHAESGLALSSFKYQKRLDKVLSMMEEGDYLLIQFGHNDQKDKRPGAGPFSTYRESLVEFVRAVKSKKGIPVLITPMERLRMDSSGNQTPTLSEYAEAVRLVGKEEQVPVIDL
ncbi:MAG: rhamnogalacturonan acetylesterase, partial [Planctomycetaceae bacterium]|nr:rhamnogalacturonan acetylesterase [Planctomycetaceae bacterium]